MSCCTPDGTCSTTGAQSTPGNVTTVYEVGGMTCGHCVQAVTKEVSAVDGVTAVAVDLATGLVTVSSTTEPDDALIRTAVDEAGYDLVGRAQSVQPSGQS